MSFVKSDQLALDPNFPRHVNTFNDVTFWKMFVLHQFLDCLFCVALLVQLVSSHLKFLKLSLWPSWSSERILYIWTVSGKFNKTFQLCEIFFARFPPLKDKVAITCQNPFSVRNPKSLIQVSKTFETILNASIIVPVSSATATF